MRSFMVREKSVEEVRKEFLMHVWDNIDYWDKEQKETTKEKITGAVFSTLAMIDGCNLDIPGFAVIPVGHESDLDFYYENGYTSIYPINSLEMKDDIGGCLHELFYPVKRQSIKDKEDEINTFRFARDKLNESIKEFQSIRCDCDKITGYVCHRCKSIEQIENMKNEISGRISRMEELIDYEIP